MPFSMSLSKYKGRKNEVAYISILSILLLVSQKSSQTKKCKLVEIYFTIKEKQSNAIDFSIQHTT